MPDDRYSHRRAWDYNKPKKENRRRKRDWVSRAVPVCNVTSWITGILALLFFGRARPRASGYVNVFFGTVVSSWNKQYLYLSLVLASAAFIIGAVGFLFNLRRNKREADHIYKSIPVLCGVMAAYMGYIMIRFSNFLF